MVQFLDFRTTKSIKEGVSVGSHEEDCGSLSLDTFPPQGMGVIQNSGPPQMTLGWIPHK